MSGVLHGVLASLAGVVKDTFFKYVTLLLPGNGTNGAQNNTFIDGSTNNFTITRNGNTTQGTFTPFGSNWSNYFDGTGDYLSGIGTTSSFNFMHNSTALFTFECWLYTTSTANQALVDNCGGTTSNIGVSIAVDAGQFILLIARGVTGVGNAVIVVTDGGAVPINQWVHLALTYDQSQASSNAKFYVNGVNTKTANKTVNIPSASNATNAMAAAVYVGGNFPVIGYLSNLRITNSIVYTAAFTPPTSPLTAITNTSLLTCQSNRFIDNSSNAFTITRNGDVSVQRFSPFSPTDAYSTSVIGGSGYFDGTGDWLSVPDSTALDINTSFTAECWVYITSSADQTFFSRGGGNTTPGNQWNSTNGHYYLFIYSAGLLYWMWNQNNAASPATLGGAVNLNAWNHIAAGFNGTTTRVWINGASVGTSTTAYTMPTTRNLTNVGRAVSNEGYVNNGYVSNLRLVKGTDVYGVGNSTITVPTSPLTAITNTQLLLNFTNAGIIDNAMLNDLETVDNAQISTAQSKFGGSSMYFDGTNDRLASAVSGGLCDFGTGDFTVEGWFNFSAAGTHDMVTMYVGASPTFYFYYFGPTSELAYFDTNASFGLSNSYTFTNAQWYHIAWCRSGTTLRIFVDGTQLSSGTYASAITGVTRIEIGSQPSRASTASYIDDLRITKGVARYTANFTPPAQAFPTS